MAPVATARENMRLPNTTQSPSRGHSTAQAFAPPRIDAILARQTVPKATITLLDSGIAQLRRKGDHPLINLEGRVQPPRFPLSQTYPANADVPRASRDALGELRCSDLGHVEPERRHRDRATSSRVEEGVEHVGPPGDANLPRRAPIRSLELGRRRGRCRPSRPQKRHWRQSVAAGAAPGRRWASVRRNRSPGKRSEGLARQVHSWVRRQHTAPS